MSIAATTKVSATTPHPMRRAGDIIVEKHAATRGPAQRDTATPDAVARDRAALVPTETVLRATPSSLRSVRPDPSFVTHLIATAEQVPQTRVLRRADVADVDAAYRSVANAYAAGAVNSRISRVA